MNRARRSPYAVSRISLALAAMLWYAHGVALGAPLSYFAGVRDAAPSAVAQQVQLRTAPAYVSVRIVQPAKDATIFDNAGNMEVTVALSPELRSDVGDRIAVILDGRQAAVQAAAQFKLSGIARGEHTLEAQVVDGRGNILAASDPVKFHMWQASRLFPNRHLR